MNLFPIDWLRRKIATDPDMPVEAGNMRRVTLPDAPAFCPKCGFRAEPAGGTLLAGPDTPDGPTGVARCLNGNCNVGLFLWTALNDEDDE